MQPNETLQQLNPSQIIKLAEANGLLSKTLKGFEPRAQQQSMMTNVIDAYNNDRIALIEAGTGTGKSLAYLIPALIWAAQWKERTVVSTHTITLQEQLVNKDIPLLLNALGLKLKVVLVKGMNNYVCLRKLEDAQMELRLFPSEENEDIQKIESHKDSMVEGSRSELPFVPSPAAWDRVGAETEACSQHECPYYQHCFFYKARRQAAEAHILVVNHSLLFSDLARRAETGNYADPAILPAYKRIILDEAHHIEEMATDYFATRLHRMELMRILGKLAVEKHQQSQGKLLLLKEKLQVLFGKTPPREIGSILSRLNIDLPALRHILNEQIHRTFESFSEFIQHIHSKPGQASEEIIFQDQKLRILEVHQAHPKWNGEIAPQTLRLIATLKEYRQAIDAMESDLQAIDNDRLREQTKGIRIDIQALLLKIVGAIKILEFFLTQVQDPNKVRWLESQKLKVLTNVHLVGADLDVSKELVNYLFSKFPTVILCSATLTSNKRFDFIRQRLGLNNHLLPGRSVTENLYESPFNYPKQVLLVVPTDMPSPLHPDFNEQAYEHIWKAIQASKGNAFILFTSYGMMQSCYEALNKRLESQNYTVFKQGDNNRQALLNSFRKTNYSVLMGTDSFWEGVDVAGDALRCVIIVKLPFKVPSEPIIQARTEAITLRGGDPFFEYSVPHAIVKFKQGFGRLIRNKWDRGCIVCLDTRLITKRYGKFFLNSLPTCEQAFADTETLYPKMVDFYRKTYHFVKNNPIPAPQSTGR
jgi:ATP-dependent DNA helicase DinG